jgi:hypothetical protein
MLKAAQSVSWFMSKQTVNIIVVGTSSFSLAKNSGNHASGVTESCDA